MIVFIAAGLFAGCTSSERMATDELNPDKTGLIEHNRVKTEMKNTARATEDYSYAQQADFFAATNNELNDIKTEFERLSDRVARSKGEAKADAEIKLTARRGRRPWRNSVRPRVLQRPPGTT